MLFSKYSGAGNDFILLDNRSHSFSQKWVPKLCDRNEGIGADGVILFDGVDNKVHKMRIFNADGSPAEMCGNGIRCFTLFLQELGIDHPQYLIENIESKLFETTIYKESSVGVKMPSLSQYSFFQYCYWGDEKIEYHFLNTGVPHIVIFTNDLENVDVETIGKALRHHPDFSPQGTNVNFVKVNDSPPHLQIRTYERGVEKETMACGTGCCAAALAAAQIYHLDAPIFIKVRSQAILAINFQRLGQEFHHVTLEGPAKKIFEGSFLM